MKQTKKFLINRHDVNREARNPIDIVVKYKHKNVSYFLESLRQVCE